MPNMDFSRVILSPRLADSVRVIRRVQLISAQGRVATEKTVYPRIVGVVTMAGPDDLERVPDYQKMGRVISFVSKFKMRGPAVSGASQFQPDQIVWYGDTYVVTNCDPYPQFGSGFTQTLAGSIDSVDEAADFPRQISTAYDFQFQYGQNSTWLALLSNH